MYIYSSTKKEFHDLKIEEGDIKLDFEGCSNWTDIDRKIRDCFGLYTDPNWNSSLNATEEEITDWFFDNHEKSLRIYAGNFEHLSYYDMLSVVNILNNCVLSSVRGCIAAAKNVEIAVRETELSKVTIMLLLAEADA